MAYKRNGLVKTPGLALNDTQQDYRHRCVAEHMTRQARGGHCSSSSSVYKPIFVRRQWRRFALYRMRLSVRMRIHCGIGLFCFSFLASVFLTRNDLLHGMVAAHANRG